MTYVEFYDHTSIENVCSILTNVPDRVILVGKDKEKIINKIKHYEKVFSNRGYEIEFIYKVVEQWEIKEVVKVLTNILNSYKDCVFGITGGDEIALVALGILYERNPDKQIQIHKVEIKNNTIYDCDNDGKTIEKEVPRLTVEENIRIYSGDVSYGGVTEGKTYLWNLTPEFCEHIETMWSICKNNTGNWNKQMDIFETIGTVGTTSVDGLEVKAEVQKVRQERRYLEREGNRKFCTIDANIISELLRKKIITSYQETETEVVIKYKDLQVKKCLTKAGQVLEMKIYLAAKGLTDVKGNKIYNDSLNGVLIDWDGDVHERGRGFHDTTNEIDVMLMHGMVPIFVSCKNGAVTVEELYKLNTVAEQFGGIYAKKVLIGTKLKIRGTNNAGQGGSLAYFKQRAKDMGITILDKVHKMNNAQLEAELSKLWKD